MAAMERNQMNYLDTMTKRKMIAQLTHPEELAEHLEGGKRTAYIGFDPTAGSLHVGSLLALMGLRRWQQAGHRAIALIGGGTVMVGDPSGKSNLRQMLDEATIASNTAKIRSQIGAFVDLEDHERGLLVDNAEWLRKLNYLDFLREIGPHFSVNRMLTAECYKQRLEKGLSFLEFNYMLLQSYDFLHLFRHYNCTVQFGGDDQWSNMLGGMELVRRLGTRGLPEQKGDDTTQAFCMTMPLLTTSDGKKMGKTESGAVWLDPDLTTPYQYYQYWRNVEDQVVAHCLFYFTELPPEEIKALTTVEGAQINRAKEVLAYHCTELCHGKSAADSARETAKGLFKEGFANLGAEPSFPLDLATIGDGIGIIDLLLKIKVVSSKSEARRLIEQNGLMVQGRKVTDQQAVVIPEDFDDQGYLLIKRGKKHYYRCIITN